MPTTTSITTTYAGEFAGQYISAALLSGSTIENGGITVKPNIKFKEVLKTVSTDDLVKDASCDFDATSTITLDERVLQPEYQQVTYNYVRKISKMIGMQFQWVFLLTIAYHHLLVIS